MATIVSIKDMSSGITQRRQGSIVIDASEYQLLPDVVIETMNVVVGNGVECLDYQGRLHWSTFYADVGFLFVYNNPASVTMGLPIARAVYVRKGLGKGSVPMLPIGKVSTSNITMDKGTITLAIEREAQSCRGS